MGLASLRLRFAQACLRRLVLRSARQVLADRTIPFDAGTTARWLAPDIAAFVARVQADTNALRPRAGMERLPSFGNRLMVEAALYTIAADRVLRRQGVPAARSAEIVSDLGWHIYRRMLAATSAPFRLLTRDPGRRLRWTIRTLLWFPFNAKGDHGYVVKSWTEGGNIHTHFKACPPQACARHLAQETEDPAILDAFRRSWCTYDWPGADLIAGTGKRGHYQRSKTLSWGDTVCDMCWAGRAGHTPDSRTRENA